MTPTTITTFTLSGNPIDVDTRDVPAEICRQAAALDLDRPATLAMTLFHDGAAALCTHVVECHHASRHLPHTPAERASRTELVRLIDTYRAAMRGR